MNHDYQTIIRIIRIIITSSSFHWSSYHRLESHLHPRILYSRNHADRTISNHDLNLPEMRVVGCGKVKWYGKSGKSLAQTALQSKHSSISCFSRSLRFSRWLRRSFAPICPRCIMEHGAIQCRCSRLQHVTHWVSQVTKVTQPKPKLKRKQIKWSKHLQVYKVKNAPSVSLMTAHFTSHQGFA